MVLIEADTVEKQQQLLECIQKDGVGIPNNFVTDFTLRFAIEERYPVNRMRFFSTEYEDGTAPTYVFVVEDTQNNNGLTSIYARPPTREHKYFLLEKALGKLIETFENNLDNRGEFRLKSDTFTKDVLNDVARRTERIELTSLATTAVFYLTENQMDFARKFQLPTCADIPSLAGFEVDAVNVERDAEKMHNSWEHGTTQEMTEEYLHYLPTTVVRDSSTGEIVSWNTTSPFGQGINQFTIPEFRGRKLAFLTEANHVKNLVCNGLRPFKYIQIQNTILFESLKKNPLSTMWEAKMDNNNEIGNNNKHEKAYFPIEHTIIKGSIKLNFN